PAPSPPGISTLSLHDALPIFALLGTSEPSVGTGLAGTLIVNVSAFELPPPGGGVDTRTEAVPAVAMSAAVIVARSWVALTKVVVDRKSTRLNSSHDQISYAVF